MENGHGGSASPSCRERESRYLTLQLLGQPLLRRALSLELHDPSVSASPCSITSKDSRAKNSMPISGCNSRPPASPNRCMFGRWRIWIVRGWFCMLREETEKRAGVRNSNAVPCPAPLSRLKSGSFYLAKKRSFLLGLDSRGHLV